MRIRNALGLIASVGLALTASVSADVFEVDNSSADFHWGFYVTFGGSATGTPYLDITQPASQPGNVQSTSAFVFILRPYSTSGDWSEDQIGNLYSQPLLQVAADEGVHVDHWFYNSYADLVLYPPKLFGPGDTVGSSETYRNHTVVSGTVRTQDQMRIPFDLVGSTDYYVGVKLVVNSEPHFGWVHLIGGSRPQPVAWAFESTPNTAIQIPAACPADRNGDGDVTSVDFFDFITAFLTSDPSADFNNDSQVNTEDFFGFLGAFFAGC